MELHENDAERRRGPAAPLMPRALSPAALADRQETFRGFGNGLALAFELAMVPFLFGLGGYALDRWLGTRPVLMVIFALVAIVGLFIRAWYEYEQEMQAHDAAGPWARVAAPVSPPTVAGEARGSEPEARPL